MNGISACIITNGKRPAHLERLIESVHAQGFPAYEVIISGRQPVNLEGEYRFIPCEEGADGGRLGLMRNTAARAAICDHLLILDDDLYLHDDFYPGLMKFGENYDLLSCRILNPDGTRFWDWKEHDGADRLIDYRATSPHVSLTGGFVLMKREVFEAVQWDETRGFYEQEDVDFSERVKRAGFHIRFNPYSTVTHDAPYTQRGKGVYRIGG